MPIETLLQPVMGFHFAVSFRNLVPAAVIDTCFQEVSGLSAELVTEDLAVGGENGFVYKMPVRTKFNNLVLKRGLTLAPSQLTQWAEDAIYELDIQPSGVQVVLLNDKHLPVAAWTFNNAYPVKIAVSDFNAMTSGIVIESFELAYQNSRRISLSSVHIPAFKTG